MRYSALFLTLSLGCLIGWANPSQGQDIRTRNVLERHALVIGNGGYKGAALKNPVADADDISSSLKSIGFKVTLRKDLTLDAMKLEFSNFADALPKGSAAIVYFAGHGVQHDGRNYLLPIDALPRIARPSDLAANAIDLGDAIDLIAHAGPAISAFLIDACRDSPFVGISGIEGGLARTTPKSSGRSAVRNKFKASQSVEGTLISYATSPGAVALDGDDGNSPYAKHLKTNLRRYNTTLETVLKLTRSGVTNETGGKQTPWYESSISGDFLIGSSDRIEFDDLLNSFSPVDNARCNLNCMIGWDAGSGTASPIKWKHAGIKWAGEPDAASVFDSDGRPWKGASRSGEVIITVDGAPSHTLLEKSGRQPVIWKVDLLGARNGAFKVALSSNVSSQEFRGFGKSRFLKEVRGCRSGSASFGSTVYRVAIAGKQKSFLREEWSCGSAGCTYDYVLDFMPEKNEFSCVQ